MQRLVSLLAAPLFGAGLAVAALPATACSDVILDPAKTLNNQVVSARTMDFPGMDYWQSQLSRVTRGVTWRSFDFTSVPGRQWTNQYGFIGMDFRVQEGTFINHQRIYNDGMNEEGLSAALLWLEVGQFVTARGTIGPLRRTICTIWTWWPGSWGNSRRWRMWRMRSMRTRLGLSGPMSPAVGCPSSSCPCTWWCTIASVTR